MTRQIETYLQNLGQLMASFQSLEFFIRALLSELPGSAPCGMELGESLYDFKVGHELLECPMTNFDSLGNLIKSFNKAAVQYGWERVDPTMVEVRDALAHGRIAYPSDEHLHPHLIKFSSPREGKVRVTLNEEMSPEWFAKYLRRLGSATDLVSVCSHYVQANK